MMNKTIRFLGVLSALIAIAALGVVFGGGLQAALGDQLVALTDTGMARAKIPVTIVAVDDVSFSALKRRWPWPREWLAKAIDQADGAGAAAIGVDVVLSDPGFTESEDAALAKAIKASGKVVLLSRFVNGNYEEPLPAFAEGAAAIGYINLVPDADGTLRRFQYIQTTSAGEVVLPSFAYALREAGLPPDSASVGKADDPAADFDTASAAARREGRLGERRIDWRLAGRDGYDVVSFADLLAGTVPAGRLSGRLVLIGAMYPESHDQFTVPGGGPNPLYGVEVHAHAIANLLPGSFPAEAGLAWWLVAAAAAALAAAVAIAFLPFVPALLVLGALLVGIAVAVPLAWQSAGLILPAVFAGIPIVASVPVLAFIHVFVENRERRRLKGYFSRYVAPSVVEHLLNQAAAPRLGGERRHVAVLFSDIAGFTTMSEQMEPEEIVELLNRYFTRMVDQVFAQEGTINKFIGDAIMALFGAPVGQDDCELRAVKTALAMRQALADFNCEQTASGGRQIKAGIGLHAGPVVVGNIGSERQMEYTVIGDTVNLCSRLEGLSRGFDADIIISDAVYRKVQAFVEVWSPEPVQVKGKQEPVQVHVLIGLK